tara:strand:- start:361 stop:918 length:558 start_codon:yes stop_codon:yes gene_type:complete
MNYYFDNQDFDDDQQWYDGLSNLEDSEITDSVKIQEPIRNMRLSKPMIIELGTSIRHTLEQMQENNINCVLTLDNENQKLNGILTERDVLIKITGKGYDFDLTMVDEFITKNPESVTLEDPLAYALNKMHVGGFRNVPVVNDDFYPIGIIGITDIIATIADHFHTDIINLPPLDKLVDKKTQEGG